MKIKFLLVLCVVMITACSTRQPEVSDSTVQDSSVSDETTENNEPQGTDDTATEANDPTLENQEDIIIEHPELEPLDPEEFRLALDSMISTYDGMVNSLDFLVGELRSIDDEEKFIEWKNVFAEQQELVGFTLEILVRMAFAVPEEHFEGFEKLKNAIDIIHEAMAELQNAVSSVDWQEEWNENWLEETEVTDALNEFNERLSESRALVESYEGSLTSEA